jgi:hypothetical protein
MDHQQFEHGDALVGVDSYVLEMFGSLPKDKHKKKRRQVNHLLKKGLLPGHKLGRFWIGSRRRLQQLIAGEAA